MKQAKLESAYQFCQNMARSHYENFPVASILLPQKLRLPISVIYAFARTADDFADEGNLPQENRLEQLELYSRAISEIKNHSYTGSNPIFIALTDVMERHNLPISLFNDLLSAFKQDVVKNRYANFEEVLDYCSRSANPVGRMLLYLNGKPSQKQLDQSDAICTALQLINFYQDIVQDYTEQNRIYIPQDILSATGLKESDLIEKNSLKIAPLMRSLYKRTTLIINQGHQLGTSLDGRMALEVKCITLAGAYTLYLLQSQADENLLKRPRLTRLDFIKIIFLSLTNTLFLRSIKKYLQS